MMFRKTNDALDLSGLDDFIGKPIHHCSQEELQSGVNRISIVLDKNPKAIMDIIANQVIPATFVLEELVEKMRNQNRIDKLALLFDNCLSDLVAACIWNSHDLKRCTKDMPGFANKVIENLLANENFFKRLLEADSNPESTLKEIAEAYPLYKDKFSESYNKLFNRSPILGK